MRKIKAFLTLFLCAACVVPSMHAGAVVINRDPISKEDEREEDSSLDTKIDYVETDEEILVIVEENEVEAADIVFAIDSTGSMSPYIQNVADNIEAFSKHLEEKTLTHLGGKEAKVKPRIAVMEYKDITCDGKDSTVVHTVDGSPWHTSTEEVIKTLQDVKANVTGGGDTPETVFDALGYVVDGKTFDFGENAHKFVVVLSDANYKEKNSFGYTETSMIAKLIEQGVNLSVITEPCYFSDYRDLVADSSDSNLFDIDSPTFSKDLEKLADVIFTTIQKEVITVKPTVTVKVTCKGDNTIKVGDAAELKAMILPETVTNKKVTWSVSDEDVASIEVSADTLTCKVTGLKEGTTKVEATTEDGAFTGSYTYLFKMYGQ